ncbi:sensor histidine kinase [Castellaniella caeni]|uniref:sensor histidine kinase n=1 Tax=Castellaniella caeni TaxID=266123 RepID=UPI0009FC455E|nr:ATP-binding protein [Castellaniella caeni]
MSDPPPSSVPGAYAAGHARSSPRHPLWLGGVVLCVAALVLATVWWVGDWARVRALHEQQAQTQAVAQLSLTALGHKLDKFRAIPQILAQDTALVATLLHPSESGEARLSTRFERLAAELGASALYLMRLDGRTVAASNWRQTDSFVGYDYHFRPYYRDAMASGVAAHFALGVVSHEPGLYLARRVDGPSGPLGVIVLKIGFHDLEAVWGRSGMPQFVTDAQGVVLLGYPVGWHYEVVRPLAAQAAARVRESLQFGAAPLRQLPFAPALDDAAGHAATLVRLRRAAPDFAVDQRFVHVELPVGQTASWRLHVLRPVSAALRQAALAAQALTLLGLMSVALAGWAGLRRRRRAARLRRATEALEAQVRVRTAELSQANERLQAEMTERRQAESRLHEMRDELAQANRLSLLGQVAAGVAHEINQPVGAIRTYADNTAEFLRRGQLERVRDNLTAIARLTERIGGITQELRAFSRKRAARIEAVSLDAALAGALMLIRPRLERLGVALLDERRAPSPWVRADALRLEQVFVNLLHNALEALEGCAAPCIRLSVQVRDDRLAVRIADNGRGIDAQARAQLFTPFYTTRAQGVGLGLVISRDLVAEFGGRLELLDADVGALFEVQLMRAEGQG